MRKNPQKPKFEPLAIFIRFLLGAVLVVPLLYSSKFVFPFITPKTIFFRAVVEVALFFYLVLIFLEPAYRPRLDKISLAILIYLFILTLASLFGINFYHSFWGNIERGEGLITLYHLFIFFFLLKTLFRTKEQWLWFFDFSLLISFLVALYALAQKLCLPWVVHSCFYRLDSLIGNASFLAAYLLFSLFLIPYLWWEKRKAVYSFLWRSLYLIVFLLNFYILFYTQTRGAILGFFLGVLIMIFGGVFFSRSRRLKISFLIGVIILLSLPALIWLNRESAWVKNQATLRRLTTISWQDLTTQSRLLVWRSSLEGFKERPLLGYGYENFNIAFNKHFPVLIFKDEGSRLWWDRAHNILVDHLVVGGVFGLISYLAIFLLVIYLLWKRTSRLVFLFFFSLLSAYFFQNLFVFDTHSSYVMFYACLALIAFLTQEADSGRVFFSEKKLGSFPYFAVFCLILIFSLIIHYFNFKPAWANHYGALGLAYAYNGLYRESFQSFQKALIYQTYQSPEIRQNMVGVAINALGSRQFDKREIARYFDYTIEQIKKNIKAFPEDVKNYLYLMTLYNASYSLDKNRLNLVLELGEKALTLSPTRPQIYFEMGQACINLGKPEKGLGYLKKGVALADHVAEAHWNLALAYLFVGDENSAQKEFEIAEKKSNRADILLRLAKLYAKKKDYQKLVEIYEELVYSPEITQKLRQPTAEDFARLAAAYRQIGEYKKAAKAALRAYQMEPEKYEDEINLFLKLLKEKQK